MTEHDPSGQPLDPGTTPPAVPAIDPAPAILPTPAISTPARPVPPTEPTVARTALPGPDPSGIPAAASAEPRATLEPLATGLAATAPVSVGPVEIAAVKRPSRARWAVAGLVALLVVALSAVGIFALVGASNSSLVASWSPADSIVYLEVRGDLPGDQRQNLGRFLAHFPGFADQSTLDQKIDETLDRLVDKASGGKHDWAKEIKPWFGGQVGLSASALPKVSGTDPAAGLDALRFLLAASQKDPAAAIAWLKTLDPAAKTADEPYANVTLTVFTPDHGPKIAATATGGVLLLGDETSVKAAVDRGGKDGLAASKDFSNAMSALSGDQVTRTYVDLKAYVDAIKAMTGGNATMALDQSMLDRLPGWLAAGGRIESDALAGEMVAPVIAGTPTVSDSQSVIAKHVPASTLVLAEGHDASTLIKYQLDQARKGPLADTFKQIDQAAAVMGGLDKLTGWLDDVGVVVTADGATPGAGIVIVPTDVDQASQIATQIKNLVALAGGSAGITMRDEPYGDGTITTIDLGDASKLTGGGASAFGLPISGHVEISYTIQNGLVIVGLGPAWVKSIVDVKPGSSLADQARYRDALDRVGASNAGSVFVDISGIRKVLEPLAAKQSGSNYATDIKPYVAPFDVFAGASRTSGGNHVVQTILTVTNP